MRNLLQDDLCMVISKHRALNEQIKAEIALVLAQYEISKRETEIELYNSDEYNLEMIKRFLIGKTVAGLTEKSIEHYKSRLKKIILSFNKPVNKITSDDLKIYFAYRQVKDKVQDTSIVNDWHVLSSFFGYLHKEDILEKNPMFKIECPKKRKKKKKAFSQMECELLRNKCEDARIKALVEVFLSTWCRVSEVSAMNIDDIQGDSITVVGKGKKERTVYLNSKAQLAIKNYLDTRTDTNRALFIGRTGNRLTNGSIVLAFKKLAEKAAVDNVHPHRFRRTGATMAIKAGMPIEKVSYLLGHESVSTTQIYLDINEDDIREAHRKWVS